VLIGESWGATLVAHYIAAHPARVERAIFVAPGHLQRAEGQAVPPLGFDRAMLAWVREARSPAQYARCLELDRLLRRDVPAAYRYAGDAEMDALFEGWINERILATAVADTARLRGRRMTRMGWWAGTMTNRSLQLHPPIAAALSRFDGPVLILRGDADYLPPMIAEQYRAAFRRSRLVRVPDAGHLIWADRPEVFAREIAGFVGDSATR
jgi:proline iminopeptidase